MNILSIFTGVSGSGRKELVQDVLSIIASDYDVCDFDVGEKLFQVARKSNLHLNDWKILDVDDTIRKLLRAEAIREIEGQISDCEFSLVGIHALFRWKNELIAGITADDISKLISAFEDKKDEKEVKVFFLTIVDDIKNVLESLRENPKWMIEEIIPKEHKNLSTKGTSQAWLNISTWIEEENFMTKFLADSFGAFFSIIPRKMNGMDVVRYIQSKSNMERKSFYLSYPISHTDPEKFKEELENIKNIMREKGFIPFDPLYIQDLMHAGALNLPEDVREHLEKRTIKRDYQFILQTDFVLVFYYDPQALSPGVFHEILFATHHGRPVYVYDPNNGINKSPFLKRQVTYISSDLKKLVNRITEDLTWSSLSSKS